MPHASYDHLLPKDAHDEAAISALAALPSSTFAGLLPDLLLWKIRSGPTSLAGPAATQALDLMKTRAAEPAVVAALTSLLSPPIVTIRGIDLARWALWDIVGKLSLEELAAFRPSLVALSDSNAPDLLELKAEAEGKPFDTYSPAAQRPSLVWHAKDVLRFLDNPSEVWTPESKSEFMCYRALQERVNTGEEMKPYVPALLEWIADGNNPPFRPCWDQLARFPEEAVEGITVLLKRIRGDGGWEGNVLRFMDENVPIGPLWERIRLEVEKMVEEAVGDEDEWELSGEARAWLRRLDRWKAEQAAGT